MLRMVRTPNTGGDTIWTSQTALFDKLSVPLQKLFEGMHAVHSSEVSRRAFLDVPRLHALKSFL